jgi:hypothetical protein
MKKTAAMPTDRCDECKQMKPAFGFVRLSSAEGGASKSLCSECYNREYMKRAGLPELETVDFEPEVRTVSSELEDPLIREGRWTVSLLNLS